MLFLELAAQSVRGFSPSIRATFKPGYLALQSPSEFPAPVAGLILALAWPDGRGGDAAYLAPGSKAGRAGLSIQSNDGAVWRIVRDLGGAGALHKLNRATNQFEVVTQDSAEMAQSLRANAGFPARTTWEQLFTLTGPQLPTRRPRGPKAAPAGASGKTGEKPALKMATNQWAQLDTGAAEPTDVGAKLKELEAELKSAKEAGEIQFALDGVNSEMYSLESKHKALDEARAKVEALRKQLASLPTPASIGAPDDIVERVKRYGDDRKRLDQALQKIAEEREATQASNEPVYVEPLLKNQQFLLALVATVALLVGPALFLEGQGRSLAMASIVTGAFAAILALRHIEELQHASRSTSKGDVYAAREKRLNDEFQLSATVVNLAMSKVGVTTPEEFLTAMGGADQLQPQLAQHEAEVAQLEADPEIAQTAARLHELKAEAERLNGQLVAMSSGYLREVRDIEREIARLQETAAPAPPPPQKAASGEFSAVPTSPTETFEDPTPALLVLATDLFTTDVPSLWSVLRDRTVQYLSALTDKRYHGVDVDKDGHATLQAPGRAVPAKELPAKDADLYFLALRLTLIEKAAPQAKLPVIIEDTFNTVLDATKQPLFGRMVKHLGTLTQVLHVSGSGQNAALADTPTAI